MPRLTPKPPPDCEEVLRSLWDFVDRELPPDAVAGIEDHLARCKGCRVRAEFEERLVTALSELRRAHPDPVTLRASVLKTLRAAGMGGGKPIGDGARPGPA